MNVSDFFVAFSLVSHINLGLFSRTAMGAMLDWRWLSSAGIAAMSIAGVALPLRLERLMGGSQTSVLEHLQYFTGGVFLGAGMLHMLPEAVREFAESVAKGTVQLPPHIDPYLLFCLGYMTVYAVEGQSQPDTGGALHKHSILAMAQRAGSQNIASASVCVVDVPPVTTYHDANAPKSGNKTSPLLTHPAQPPGLIHSRTGSYGHGNNSFGHEHQHVHELPHHEHQHGHQHLTQT